MNRKGLEERSIKDNFVFGAVMQNPRKCKSLLECILGIKIRKIKYPELEKTIDKAIGSKSVRLVDDTVKIILNTKGTMDDVGEDVKELLHYIAGQEPKSELTRSLDAEVSRVKSSRKWRRKFMTLLMRDNENKTLGQYMKLVGQIRKINVNECKVASKFLDVDEEFIRDVIELLEEHPTMDDEEIAEIVMDW